MVAFKDFLFRMTHATPERKASRSYLKKAKKGDVESYLALTAHYLNLAIVYFGSCSREETNCRHTRVEQVFSGLWQQLPYAERVSDFEFMLANALVANAPENGVLLSSEALVSKLRRLTPDARFAFIAYEFEKWPLRWVALVMRLKPSELHRLLSKTRCKLCEIEWASLAGEERACLEALSAAMETATNLRTSKAICARVSAYPRVSEIRAQWLELRPELVEVRHRYLPEPAEREALMSNVLNATKSISMQQPRLVDRVVNTVHFKRHTTVKVS